MAYPSRTRQWCQEQPGFLATTFLINRDNIGQVAALDQFANSRITARRTEGAPTNGFPMNDVRVLSNRIDALEIRLAFQDETIETLNNTITSQWQHIDALTRQLANLNERLQEAEANAPRPANERPPHY